MAVPGPVNPLLTGVPQAAFSAIDLVIRERVASAGDYTTGALFGAVSKAVPILKEYGLDTDTRKIAFAVVQFLSQRATAGIAFEGELIPPPGAVEPGLPPGPPTVPAIIPVNPNLEPGEFRYNVTIGIIVPEESEVEPRTVQATIRRHGVPSNLDDMLNDILNALTEFAESYELANLEELIVPDTLRITRVEIGA